jgi:hypothetical protein
MPTQSKVESMEKALDTIESQIEEVGVLGLLANARVRLPGAPSDDLSDTIRDIVSRQYTGYSHVDISETLGKSKRYVENLQRQYIEAFDSARADHIARALYERGRTTIAVSAAISDIGPAAVLTMKELMRDPTVPPAIRLKAALGALEMIKLVEPKREAVPQGNVNVNVVNEIKQSAVPNEEFIDAEIDKPIDAEDAEIVE